MSRTLQLFIAIPHLAGKEVVKLVHSDDWAFEAIMDLPVIDDEHRQRMLRNYTMALSKETISAEVTDREKAEFVERLRRFFEENPTGKDVDSEQFYECRMAADYTLHHS